MARYVKNEAVTVPAINAELEKIQEAIEDSLSRSGNTPNTMTAPLDMNGQRIINLPEAVSDSEPMRKGEAQPFVDAAAASAASALASEQAAAASDISASNSKDAAAVSETNAAGSATAAATSATSASNSASAASASASNAAGSATAAATSATNAASSATSAASSATSASDSATSASTSAENAASSEAAALASETAAGESASNALASEQAASTSETNAATSASQAASSALAAEAEADRAKDEADRAEASNTVLLSALADTDSTVLVGGVEAGVISKRAGGSVTLEEFSGTAREKLQAAYDSGAVKIRATLPEYDFGAIGGDAALFTFTRFVDIDFNNALIKVQGDNSSAFTGTTFIRLLDTTARVYNYLFDDENFLQAGPSRGVVPISISNQVQNTRGYSFGNFKVIRGQSLLTCSSQNPSTARASNIRFFGHCSGVNVYYGVNLANNGDDFEGSYSLETYKRAFFGYGTKRARARFYAGAGAQPTSSPLLVSYSSRPTEDYDIDGYFEVLNGQPRILNQGGVSGGLYKDINIKMFIKSIGTNGNLDQAFVVGPDSAGDSLSVFGLNLTYEADVAFTNAVTKVNCIVERLFVNSKLSSTSLSDLTTDNRVGLVANGKFNNTRSGGLSTGVFIPANYITLTNKGGLGLFTVTAQIYASADTSFFGQRVSSAIYSITGFVSSDNVVSITGSSVVNRHDIGASPHPTITISGGAGGITISADTFTASNSSLRVSLL